MLETRLANVILINSGGNIVSDNINSLLNGETFVLSQGISQDVETGSHVEATGVNFVAGISSNNETSKGNLTVGAFAEYGKGKYDSYLDDGTHGKGDSRYYGGGVAAKFTANSGLYAEGSLRGGRTDYDYASDNGLLNTNSFTFDLKSNYFGAHFGLGREFYSDNNIFDLYAKYYYLRVGGNSFTQGGVGVEFDSVESHRARVGFRDSLKFGEYNSLYIGAAYEYEFVGEANGMVSHPAFGSAGIASPSLKGSTGIGEIGYIFENGRFRFDIGAKGFVGRQRGYSGNIGFTFKF
ncbi:autotransporter outer membrane beta-barrel domain-containing protein [Campylobacter sp. CN_EL2]|uniref:autotransporter outer membrane beta-barrel domain-containing protein n=1 Tax=Campylobacter sp. CN_EL2 TaxID=2984144 RepID=UPI0022E9F4FD|nr:autotransporter outer membrane beta-barrel domain-containing protein [Campylobacter sp. CN_EL2]MDA3089427.1 autotransporter outer membrane beta-barrel domain-containing protein [Campylobacter sp. CN_EL1]